MNAEVNVTTIVCSTIGKRTVSFYYFCLFVLLGLCRAVNGFDVAGTTNIGQGGVK